MKKFLSICFLFLMSAMVAQANDMRFVQVSDVRYNAKEDDGTFTKTIQDINKQKDVKFNGHSIECRINAENPAKNFRPCPGTITGVILPGGNGVRVDTAIYSGYTIPSNYDSMIAKIITHGDTRNEAISKMKRALEETVIEGVDTNIDFLFKIIKNPNFIRGNFDTSFIEKEILK